MSPSPATPHINESKMKLYEMFAQKQLAPPPNLTHPSAISSVAGGTSTSISNTGSSSNCEFPGVKLKSMSVANQIDSFAMHRPL